MPLLAPVVFPLFAINPDGSCACGNTACNRVGKHPAVLWGEISHGDPVPRPKPGAGAGIKTGAAPKGSGIIVVDVDNLEALEALVSTFSVPETYEIETGRGVHLYFEHPGFTVRNFIGELLPGVDIRGDGGFVVAPGSPHKSGKTYTILNDRDPAPCPEWLVEWLRARPGPSEARDYPGDVTDPEERGYRRELYTAFLKETPPCVEGHGGDERLFEVVQHGAYDLQLPTEDVLELVAEHFDPRCEPPWGESLDERVRHKAHSAKTSSTRPRAEPFPRGFLEPPPKPDFVDSAPAPTIDLPIMWGGWDKPFNPPPYLVAGLIPEGKIVTFFAEGGSVKTWAAFALAIAVATGTPWLDHHVEKGKALILDFEDGEYEYKRRRRMLCKDNLEDIPDLGYLYGGPQLNKLDLWKSLVPLGIRLLVVDALSSGMPSDADENSNAFAEAVKQAGRFSEACERLGKPCTVIFVHHANKQGGMRGFSGVRDQSDCVFKFEPVSETDAVKRMRIVCDKPGPQKKPPPVNVELSDDGLHTFEDEASDEGRNATTPEELQRAILLYLDGHGPEKSIEEIARRIGKKKVAVTKEIRVLEDREAIVRLKDGWLVDSDEKRKNRILDAIRRHPSLTTIHAVATHAGVKRGAVQALIDDGVICSRTRGGEGAGGFMEVDRGRTEY
jgi:hypothetical protein